MRSASVSGYHMPSGPQSLALSVCQPSPLFAGRVFHLLNTLFTLLTYLTLHEIEILIFLLQMNRSASKSRIKSKK
ncbi:MAG: hypothetical protein B6245_00940 [Desulfobacteraceae bacterium 4572_88]|nr:MAG: hypothetical protein B6245_00940 [Desulfobacteraceae bacterium 4572_88]RLC21434.1 MAG: hypothetical protein DRI57_02335 [Deltaproteobacteria bacterium]